MRHITTKLTGAALASLLATGAYAVPTSGVPTANVNPSPVGQIGLSAGDSFTNGDSLNGMERLTFDFVANEAIRISAFSFSGTGTNGGRSLSQAQFGYGLTDPAVSTAEYMTEFSTVSVRGSAAGAMEFIDGQRFAAGDRFFISMFNPAEFANGENAFSITGSFDVAAVPVPAAGLLLLGALAAGGVVTRRKKAA